MNYDSWKLQTPPEYDEARADDNDGVDQSRCPRCGEWIDDFDGFGVLAHVAPMPDACGYCSHPSRDGDGKGNMVCGICGAVQKEQP